MVGERQCGFCGFLAQRAQWQQGPVPGHREVAPEARRDPALARLIYVPTVPLRQFEADLVCYRRVPVFPESDVNNVTLINDPGRAREALLANRQCDEWCEYIPGLDPRDHLMERRLRELEDDRRAFQAALNRHSTNLTWAAIILALFLGVFQMLTMTRDSLLYKLVAPLFSASTTTPRDLAE